ncbi:DUF1858 domain-containing protein [Bacteroidota bacterium]
MNKLIITPDITVAELLNEYPQLENKLIEIAPVFSKLKNPVLRKTIAKVTSLKQASIVGGVKIGDLVNTLRKEVGQNEEMMEQYSNLTSSGKPDWLDKSKIKIEYDASVDLNNGIHPVAKVTKEISVLNNDEIYVVYTPFVPAPLIEIIRSKGFDTFTEEVNPSYFATYINRSD